MAATIIPRHGTTTGYETAEKNGKIYDDAKAAAGIKDQLDDSRGLSTIVIDAVGTVTAMPLYELCKQLDLVNPGYYRSKFIDTANTVQYIEIGRISSGDAQVVKRLCDKAGIEYKVAA